MNNIHPLRPADDDDVRGAFRALTVGLETPVTDIVTEATGRGRTLKRRRTIVRVVAPLAVAAVVAPLALAASGSLSLPDLGSREGTVAGPSVTVLDPGTPVPEPAAAPAPTPEQSAEPDPNGEAFPATSADNPAPASIEPDATAAAPGAGGEFSFPVAQGDPVLQSALLDLFDIDATLTHVDMVDGVDDMPAELQYRLNHGDEDRRVVSAQVDDGTGVGVIRVVVSKPETGWTWAQWIAEDGPCNDCVVDDDGALQTSTETATGETRNYGMWVTRDGHRVDVFSSTADGSLTMGGQITRQAPLLTTSQVGELAQWPGWWN